MNLVSTIDIPGEGGGEKINPKKLWILGGGDDGARSAGGGDGHHRPSHHSREAQAR